MSRRVYIKKVSEWRIFIRSVEKTLSNCVLVNTESKIHSNILNIFAWFYRVETGRTLSVCEISHLCTHLHKLYIFSPQSFRLDWGIVRFGDRGKKKNKYWVWRGCKTTQFIRNRPLRFYMNDLFYFTFIFFPVFRLQVEAANLEILGRKKMNNVEMDEYRRLNGGKVRSGEFKWMNI